MLVLGGSKFMGKALMFLSVVSTELPSRLFRWLSHCFCSNMRKPAKHDILRFCRGVCGDDSGPCPPHVSD